MEAKKTPSINEALMHIQLKLNAPKDAYNSFGRYKYRSAESILSALKPLLAEVHCVLTINDDIRLIGDRYYIVATATLSNGVDSIVATAMAREEDSKKGMDASQVTGATSSYARKYALGGLFAIDDTADADKLNTSANYTQNPQPTKPMSNEVMSLRKEVEEFCQKATRMEELQLLKETYINNINDIRDILNERAKVIQAQIKPSNEIK